MGNVERDLKQLFEATYTRLVRGRGVTDDAEELALVEELLAEARAGAVPDDDGQIVRVSTGVEPDLEADLAGLGGGRHGAGLSGLNWRKAAPALGIFGLAVVVLVWGLLQGGAGRGRRTAAAEDGTLTVTMGTAALTLTADPDDGRPPLTPTPAAAGGTPAAAPSPAAPAETPGPGGETAPTPAASPGPVETETPALTLSSDLPAPAVLRLPGAQFPVVPTGIAGGTWAVAARPDAASWLAGTYANRAFALYGDTHRELLRGLAPGARLSVVDDRGGVVDYEVVRSGPVGVTEIDLFSQQQLGLVLVQAGTAGAERWAVIARPAP